MSDSARTLITYLGNGEDDGTVLGHTTDALVGFYGETTPVAKKTVTLGAGTTTQLLKTDVQNIVSCLDNMGLLTKE